MLVRNNGAPIGSIWTDTTFSGGDSLRDLGNATAFQSKSFS